MYTIQYTLLLHFVHSCTVVHTLNAYISHLYSVNLVMQVAGQFAPLHEVWKLKASLNISPVQSGSNLIVQGCWTGGRVRRSSGPRHQGAAPPQDPPVETGTFEQLPSCTLTHFHTYILPHSCTDIKTQPTCISAGLCGKRPVLCQPEAQENQDLRSQGGDLRKGNPPPDMRQWQLVYLPG